MSSGLVSAIRRDSSGRIERIQTSAAISGGSSGGGLFDEDGALIGLTTSGIVGDAQNLNFAIPADWIKELWQRHARVYPVPPAVAPPVVVAAAPEPVQPAPAPTQPPVHAPAPTPAPAPAPPWIASPIPPPVDTGSVRAGDEFEYAVKDEFTGLVRRVIYRVDAVDDDRVVFNGGARAERLNGDVVAITNPIGGDMDVMSPPGGWARSPLSAGGRWQVQFSGNGPFTDNRYQLEAEVGGESTLSTAAGPVRVFLIRYSGWGTVHGLASFRRRVRVDVWYAPALRRVVRFHCEMGKANGVNTSSASRESAELVAIRRE